MGRPLILEIVANSHCLSRTSSIEHKKRCLIDNFGLRILIFLYNTGVNEWAPPVSCVCAFLFFANFADACIIVRHFAVQLLLRYR